MKGEPTFLYYNKNTLYLKKHLLTFVKQIINFKNYAQKTSLIKNHHVYLTFFATFAKIIFIT
jgi:hypothetical protein